MRLSEISYAGGPVKAESNSTSDAAFAGSVRTDDHVKMRTWTEFDVIVGQKVVQLNANDRAWNITRRKWELLETRRVTERRTRPCL